MTPFGAMDKGEVRVLFFRLDEKKKRSSRARHSVRAVLLLETNVLLTFVFLFCFRFELEVKKEEVGAGVPSFSRDFKGVLNKEYHNDLQVLMNKFFNDNDTQICHRV